MTALVSMHIGILTPEYPAEGQYCGGIANYSRKIGHALAARGHTVTVFWLSDQQGTIRDSNGALVRRVRRPGIKLRRWGALGTVIRAYANSYALKREVKRVHRERPIDLLHTTNYRYPALAFLKNRSVPLVCRVSSYAPLLLAASGLRRTATRHVECFLEVRQIAGADISFCPSEFMARIYQRFESIHLDIVRTPSDPPTCRGVDESIYHREKLNGRKYLLYVGTLNGIKGVDLLAQALPPVLAEVPSVHVVLVGPDHGGPGVASMADYLMQLNSPFADRVHYLGPLPKKQLYGVLKHAYAVVLPSRVDNLPNTCIEAREFGKVVVGTRDSSIEELITDGETGILVDNQDVESLTSGLRRVLSLPPEELERMRQAILQANSRDQDEDRVGQLLDLYGRALTGFQRKSKPWE